MKKMYFTGVALLLLSGCAGLKKYEPMMRKTVAKEIGDYVDLYYQEKIGTVCTDMAGHKDEFKQGLQDWIIKK